MFFTDKQYADAGLEISEDMLSCDVLFGVKEVPIEALIANKNISSLVILLKNNPITEIY